MPAPTLISPPPAVRIALEPLTPQSFSPFGTVITTPFSRDLATPPANLTSFKSPHPLLTIPLSANQGSAVKISPITPLPNGYEGVCPSGRAAQARMSMFASFPRKSRGDNDGNRVFDVRILERHPYTTQTFIPLDLSSRKRVVRDLPKEGKDAMRQRDYEDGLFDAEESEGQQHQLDEEPLFLVIVAPTLRGQTASATTSTTGEDPQLRVSIRDPPDLENLRAFVARGGQAVTYGVGTWHAPMVVLGARRVDFVVAQYMNGVDEEDCQEAAFTDGIVVDVESLKESDGGVLDATSGRRSKL
jgi:ureidoglycolate lyase